MVSNLDLNDLRIICKRLIGILEKHEKLIVSKPNTVEEFINYACLIGSSQQRITAKKFYEHYQSYCKSHGYTPEGKKRCFDLVRADGVGEIKKGAGNVNYVYNLGLLDDC